MFIRIQWMKTKKWMFSISTTKLEVEFTIQELIFMVLDTNRTISTDSTLGEVASVYTYEYGTYNWLYMVYVCYI